MSAILHLAVWFIHAGVVPGVNHNNGGRYVASAIRTIRSTRRSFPNATLVDYWASYKVDAMNGPGLLWEDHPDRYEIAPGIEVLRTPGRTYFDASLLVTTKAPKKTVVCTRV